jgi:hypothetical protein
MNRLSYWIHTLRLLLRDSQVLYMDGRYIIIDFFDYRDCYMAAATTKEFSVWNCYGSTKEAAKEMALFRIKQFQEREPTQEELVHQGEHFAIYRDK